MTKEIVTVSKESVEIGKITKEDVRRFFCQEATDNEIALFLKIAQLNNLNPFKRELYLVKYGSYPASIVTGYEVYLKRADRTLKWGGFKVWTEGNLPDMKAKIEIYRKDWDHPLCHEVEYSEYVQKTKEGAITRFWKEKPKTMLKKVVTCQGFRLAFPDEMGGLPYAREEIEAEVVQDETQKQIEMPKAKETTAGPAPAAPAEQKPTTTPAKDEPCITAAQAEYLEKMATKAGLTDLPAYLKKTFGVEHAGELKLSFYADAMNHVIEVAKAKK